MSTAGPKTRNWTNSYAVTVLSVIITLVVIATATFIVLPNIKGTTSTTTSTTTSNSTTSTICVIAVEGAGTYLHIVSDSTQQPLSGISVHVVPTATSCFGANRPNPATYRTNSSGWIQIGGLQANYYFKTSLVYEGRNYSFTLPQGPLDMTYATLELPSGKLNITLCYLLATSNSCRPYVQPTNTSTSTSTSTVNLSPSNYVCVRAVSDYYGTPIEGVEFNCSPAIIQNGITTVTTILIDVKTNSSGWAVVQWTHSDVMMFKTEYQGKEYNFTVPMFLGENYVFLSLPSGKVTTAAEIQAFAGWEMAVKQIISDSESVKVEQVTTKKEMTFSRGEKAFGQILNILSNTTVVHETAKTMITDDKTVSVTIPYTYDWLLTFRLGNSTSIKLDLVESQDTIWFETETTIYEVSVSRDVMSLWNTVVESATSTSTETNTSTTTCIMEIDPIPIPDLRSLKGNSSEVIVGTVVERADLKLPNIYASTVFRVYVNQTVKGNLQQGSIIFVGQLGTESCPARQDPLMKTGDKVILFMGEYPNSTIWSIFAAQQGRFIIQDGKVSSLNFIYPDSWTLIKVHDIPLAAFLKMIRDA